MSDTIIRPCPQGEENKGKPGRPAFLLRCGLAGGMLLVAACIGGYSLLNYTETKCREEKEKNDSLRQDMARLEAAAAGSLQQVPAAPIMDAWDEADEQRHVAEITRRLEAEKNQKRSSSHGYVYASPSAIDIEAVDVEPGSGIDVGPGFGLSDPVDSPGGSAFSRAGGSAFEGYYYDLTRSRRGEKSEFYAEKGATRPAGKQQELDSLLRDFTSIWAPSLLQRYKRSEQPFYTAHFYRPLGESGSAPLAVSGREQPETTAWAAYYTGRVRAPKTGTFRFVGMGDDILAVRFNRKTVLVAEGGELAVGSEFSVEEGKSYPIEVLLADTKGEQCGFALLVEDMSDNPQGDKPEAERCYNIFRTNFALPDEPSGPAYNEDSSIWVVVP